jgi:clostripain
MSYDGKGTFVDLYDLASRVAEHDEFSDSIRSAARGAMATVDDLVVASFGMGAYAGFQPGRNGLFIVLPNDGADRGKLFDWYTPGPGARGHHGRWAFLSDGATAGNGAVENWFELIDSWFDGATGAAAQPQMVPSAR